jgi:hypothetical protein
MKKKITSMIILLSLFGLSVFADVSMRLKYISHTHNPGIIHTIRVDVEAQANYDYPISKFQGSFDMGDSLEYYLQDVQFNPLDEHFFPDSTYDKDVGYSESQVYYVYNLIHGDCTKTTLPNDTENWTKINEVTITYDETYGAYTTFTWSDAEPLYSVEVIAYIDLGGGQVPVPIPVTGGRVSIPDELVDMSLPVQMTSFFATYEYEEGVTINWETSSEANCAGFNILRKEDQNEYKKITTQKINGQGNTSVSHEYSFCDRNVKNGSTYFYIIEVIPENDYIEAKSYFGPMPVQTVSTPSEFSLSQNYPNPFNPSTMINYAISEKTNVLLKVYNILGEEVCTLVDKIQNAQHYTVLWNGLDTQGNHLPSGLYFYKLSAGNLVDIRKMIKLE